MDVENNIGPCDELVSQMGGEGGEQTRVTLESRKQEECRRWMDGWKITVFAY